jgi:hypothetical protein
MTSFMDEVSKGGEGDHAEGEDGGIEQDDYEDDEEDVDGCFFADATLEDAHQLVESPGAPMHTSTSFSARKAAEADSSCLPPPPPLFDGKNKQQREKNNNGRSHPSSHESDDRTREMKRFTNLDIAFSPQHSTHSITTVLTNGSHGNDEHNMDSPTSADRVRDIEEEREVYNMGNHNLNHTTDLRRRRPALPRDIAWAAYASIFLPMSLILPWWITHRNPDKYASLSINEQLHHVHDNDESSSESSRSSAIHGWNQVASSHRGHVATLISVLAAFGVANFLSTMMYRNPLSGDDGEDERHLAASRITLVSHYMALLMYPTLIAMLFTEFPEADHVILYSFILIFWGIRDMWTLRKSFNCLSLVGAGNGTGDTGRGRRMFFQTLTCASLDIISRSLRRMVFYRIVSGAILLQLILVLLWRGALFQGLGVPVDNDEASFVRVMLIVISLIGGKWMTAIVARVLGLIASGGVTIWFAQQHRLLEPISHSVVGADILSDGLNSSSHLDPEEENSSCLEMADYSSSSEVSSGEVASETSGAVHTNGVDSDMDVERATNNPAVPHGSRSHNTTRHTRCVNPNPSIMVESSWEESEFMSDAYASANPNEYRSVNNFDDPNMLHDDNEWGEEQLTDTTGPNRSWLDRFCTFRHAAINSNYIEGTTAKHFLLQATTLSFGSVAQCAFLGGIAQFLWSCTRNVRIAHTVAQRRRGGQLRPASTGFESMHVAGDESSGMGRLQRFLLWAHVEASRFSAAFVRSHTDYSMAHVAAYFKSYQRAAQDVFILMDSSGKKE